jgi:protein-disulfide isomerase
MPVLRTAGEDSRKGQEKSALSYGMLKYRLSAVSSAAAVLILLTGCSPSAAQQPRPQTPSDIVATVGSTSITLAEVDEKALQQSTGSFGAMKLSQALFEARRLAVEGLIEDELLAQDARARKLDQATVIQQEITAKVAEPTDAETALWFQQNQSRLQGASLEQAGAAIKSYLVQQRTLAARQQYVDGLRAKVATRIMLDPPRQVIAKADRPSKGPATAPIEMIEFSDFQCPFCVSAVPTVNQVLSEYGDRIHFTYRHYPLATHPRARPAAEASQCAAEQGKFWQFHDKLFADQSRLGDEDFKQHAAQLGLDTAQFAACVDSHKYQAEIDTDIRVGNEAGVSGTPAFYINGRMLSGAQPFEAFKRIIDEELALKR